MRFEPKSLAVGALAAGILGVGATLAWSADQPAVNAAPVAPARPASATPTSFADIVARVAPAVVSIEVEGRNPAPTALAAPQLPPGFEGWRQLFPNLGEPQPFRGAGSGFFVSADGYVVTNNHVVERADRMTVRTADGRSLKARLVGRDPDTDLAVLKVDGSGFPFVSFQELAKPRVGDWVVAVGNPFNLGGTATAGIVSAQTRRNVSGSSYVDYMQIDAPINRGNSGGPTFDVEGRVVGVNTAIFSPSGGSVGIGFDIPADVAARVTRQLIAEGRVVRGYIGARVQDITPEIAESLGLPRTKGALVAEVDADGPAGRAGVRPGDLVLSADGRPVDSAAALTRAVAAAAPGSRLALGVSRNGRDLTLPVKTDERPAPDRVSLAAASPMLGLTASPGPAGLRVEAVEPGSDAARKGIRPGDVLQSAAGRPLHRAGDLAAAVAAARAAGRSAVLMEVVRGGQRRFLALALPAHPPEAG